MASAVSLRIPAASGPHPVGCTDVLVGAGTEGGFFRLFYPCSAAPKTRAPWCPRPEYLAALVGSDGKGRAAKDTVSFPLGNPQIAVTWNGKFLPGTDRKPLVIFSHGLTGFRAVYSSLCMELASNGFLIASVEHRDGSACATYHLSEGDGSTSPREIWIPYKHLQPGMKEFYLRNYQVHQRATECVRIVRLLQDVDAGRRVSNLLDSSFSLDTFKDRIDFNRVAVMGHSLGGATALLSLVKDNIFRCAVVLDAWLFPLEDTCYRNIQKPILLINTESFQTRQSVEKIKRMNSEGADLQYMTVNGCKHFAQSDLAFLTGDLAKSLGAQQTMDPHHSLKIHVASSLNFLRKHLDLPPISVPNLEDLREVIQAQVIYGFPLINSKL